MANYFAIHTVFILKENILFLEQWIHYHILLGFDKFYLYDNSKVRISSGCHPKHECFVPGKTNKYNVNYDELITDAKANKLLNKILLKYKDNVRVIEWSPLDCNNVVLHNQVQAHNHCLEQLKRDKIGWCAVIDMDEYIVVTKFDNIKQYVTSLDPLISNIKLGQRRFETRFSNTDKLIIDITKAESKQLPRTHSNKNLFRVNRTKSLTVHDWMGRGKQFSPDVGDILFNHYKLTFENANEFVHIDNIHPTIKCKIHDVEYSV